MEQPWLESSEAPESPQHRQLEDATFDPCESVERLGEIGEAEHIEGVFRDLMEGSVPLDETDTEPVHMHARGAGLEHAAPEGISDFDSFTWKLSLAHDEVGDFRTPTMHAPAQPVLPCPAELALIDAPLERNHAEAETGELILGASYTPTGETPQPIDDHGVPDPEPSTGTPDRDDGAERDPEDGPLHTLDPVTGEVHFDDGTGGEAPPRGADVVAAYTPSPQDDPSGERESGAGDGAGRDR